MSVGAIRAGRAMVEIFADSSPLVRGLAGARGKLARFANDMRRLGTTQIIAGGALAAPIVVATKEFASLEQRMNAVRALAGGTAAQMSGLGEAVKRIGMKSGRNLNEIADGMGELVRAGVKIRDLEKATRIIADFSRAAEIDMARGAQIGIQVLTQAGLEMNQLSRVTDVLQEMANATVSTVDDLADGFRYAGQTARLFGLSIEEAGAAVAYLQQSGLQGSTAGTALNQMFMQLIKNIDNAEKKIGGLRDANGALIPFEQILKKVRDHAADLPQVEKLQFLNEIFGLRGMRGAASLIQNIEMWTSLSEQAQRSSGATKRKALEMAKAFQVSFDSMVNGLRIFAYAIGESLADDLKSAFQAIGSFAVAAADFVKANAGMVKAIALTSAGLIASGVATFAFGMSIQLASFAVGGLLKVVSMLAAPLVLTMKTIGLIARQMTYLTNVTGKAVTVLYSFTAAVFRAAYSAVQLSASLVTNLALNMQGIVAAGLSNAANLVIRLGSALSGTLSIFTSFGALSRAVGAGLITVASATAGTVAVIATFGVAIAVLAPLMTGVIQAASMMASGVSSAFGKLASDAMKVWPAMKASAAAGWDGIVTAIQIGDLSLAWKVFVQSAQVAFAQIMQIIGPWYDAVVYIISDIASMFSSAFQSIASAFAPVGDMLQSAFSGLADIGNSVLEGFAAAFPGLASIFGSIASSAGSAGAEILSYLSAGDIVKAWIAGTAQIEKLFLRIKNAYQQNVGGFISRNAIRMGQSGAESRIGGVMSSKLLPGDSINDTVRRRGMADKLFGARDSDEYNAAKAGIDAEIASLQSVINAGRAPGATSQQQNAVKDAREIQVELKNALNMVRQRLKDSGSMTEAERAAQVASDMAGVDAATQKRMADLDNARADKRRERQETADRLSAQQMGSVSAAREAKERKGINTAIDDATTMDDITRIKDQIKRRRQATLRADKDAGLSLGGKSMEEQQRLRGEKAEELRMDAAGERRAGRFDAAEKAEALAAQLEMAFDAIETANLYSRANEAKAAIQEQIDMRKKPEGAGDAKDVAQKDLFKDVIGSFASAAQDRMGYGRTLAEKQAKDTSRIADGIDKLVGLVDEGEGIIS